MPRTFRSISPRLTVSMSTVERCTPGAAGFMRETATVMPAMAATATTARPMFLMRRLRAADRLRGTSIVLLGVVKPVLRA